MQLGTYRQRVDNPGYTPSHCLNSRDGREQAVLSGCTGYRRVYSLAYKPSHDQSNRDKHEQELERQHTDHSNACSHARIPNRARCCLEKHCRECGLEGTVRCQTYNPTCIDPRHCIKPTAGVVTLSFGGWHNSAKTICSCIQKLQKIGRVMPSTISSASRVGVN